MAFFAIFILQWLYNSDMTKGRCWTDCEAIFSEGPRSRHWSLSSTSLPSCRQPFFISKRYRLSPLSSFPSFGSFYGSPSGAFSRWAFIIAASLSRILLPLAWTMKASSWKQKKARNAGNGRLLAGLKNRSIFFTSTSAPAPSLWYRRTHSKTSRISRRPGSSWRNASGNSSLPEGTPSRASYYFISAYTWILRRSYGVRPASGPPAKAPYAPPYIFVRSAIPPRIRYYRGNSPAYPVS